MQGEVPPIAGETMSTKPRYVLICDEVRKEETGKFILIGVYTPDIHVPKVPATLQSLTFFVCIDMPNPGEKKFAVELRPPSGKAIATGNGGFVANQRGPAYIPLRFLNLTFPEAGAYEFWLTPEGENRMSESFRVLVPEETPKGP